MGRADVRLLSTRFASENGDIHFRPHERSTPMKSVVSILLVAFVFGAVSLLAAQEPQTTAPPSVASAFASPANTMNSGVIAEPGATSSDQQMATTPPQASESPAEGRADSENKPVLDRQGNPDPAQNLIEYGGPG
jgi:hypothetical protein